MLNICVGEFFERGCWVCLVSCGFLCRDLCRGIFFLFPPIFFCLRMACSCQRAVKNILTDSYGLYFSLRGQPLRTDPKNSTVRLSRENSFLSSCRKSPACSPAEKVCRLALPCLAENFFLAAWLKALPGTLQKINLERWALRCGEQNKKTEATQPESWQPPI